MFFGHGETALWAAWQPTTDGRNNQVDGWAAPVTVDDCGFDPGASIEPRDGSSRRVTTMPVLYPPTGHPYGPHDRWIVRGVTYQAEGEAADWRHPMTGWEPGVAVINLQRVEG